MAEISPPFPICIYSFCVTEGEKQIAEGGGVSVAPGSY